MWHHDRQAGHCKSAVGGNLLTTSASAVSGVNGLREVTTTSREGVSSVVLSLELGVDTDVALNDVRTILAGAIPAAVMALVIHAAFEGLDRVVVPRSLRAAPSAAR